MLSQGIRHKSSYYQVRSLEGLLELDNPAFTRHCTALLAQLPREWGKDEGASRHIAFLGLALSSEDPATRELAWTLAKKMPLPMRIALLAHLPIANLRPGKNIAIAFLARFLDDAEIYPFDEKHTRENLFSDFQGFQKSKYATMRRRRFRPF